MERQKKKVYIDNNFWVGGNVNDLINHLHCYKDKYNVKDLYIERSDDNDSLFAIFFFRDETDDEYNNRIDKENKIKEEKRVREIKRKEEQDEIDRKMYERLKKKFGDV